MENQTNLARDWRSKFQKNYDLYGGKLIRLFNLSHKDVGVYIFLITRKWYSDQSQFSKNSISNEMNSIPVDFQPQENALRYDPKTVEMSLIKLENYGLVTKCKNHQEKKLGHRPPDFLYVSNDITEVLVETKKRLENTIKDMLGLLAELENTEEDSFWYKSQIGGKKND